MNHIANLYFVIFYMCSQLVLGQNAMVGAFYFDGWTEFQWNNYKNINFQGGAYNDVLVYDFPEREPAYGWVTSTKEGVQKQIQDAIEAQLDYFIFDYYYCSDTEYEDCFMNNALKLFMEQNPQDLKFMTMVTNDIFDFNSSIWNQTEVKLIEQFQHPSYLKLDDQPVVLFYLGKKMIQNFGSVRKFNRAVFAFREKCLENGLKEPLIGIANVVQDYNIRRLKSVDFLFTYNHPNLQVEYKVPPISGKIYDGNTFVESELTYWDYLLDKSKNKYFVPTLTIGWDRRPWDQNVSFYQTRPTREYVQYSMEKAMEFNETKNYNKLHDLIFIYAWNEYAEGGYISPMKNGEFIGLGIKDAKENEKKD